MESDKFKFKVALKDTPNNHCGVLSLISTVYDPAKKLLQDLCREKHGWDDSISHCDGERWEKWKSQLANLSQITVNRCVRLACFGDLKIAELHNFVDESQIAYGAKDQLRVSYGEVSPCSSGTNDCAKVGTVSCSLSRSVRPHCKRRAGYSNQPIHILVRLHLCVAVHQKSVKAFPYICCKPVVSYT